MTLKTFPRKFVGLIGVEAAGEGARLGFWLGRPYWGAGLMSEAVEAVTDAFFRVTEGDELAALVAAGKRSLARRAGKSRLRRGGAARVRAGTPFRQSGRAVRSAPPRLAGGGLKLAARSRLR